MIKNKRLVNQISTDSFQENSKSNNFHGSYSSNVLYSKFVDKKYIDNSKKNIARALSSLEN